MDYPILPNSGYIHSATMVFHRINGPCSKDIRRTGTQNEKVMKAPNFSQIRKITSELVDI